MKTGKPITLRNLPPTLDRAIRERARRRGTSANKAVIGLLEERLGRGTPREPLEARDLDALAGTWTRGEAEEFDAALARQRLIDRKAWK